MEEYIPITVKQIQKRFKLHGLPIRPDAVEAIISVLNRESNANESLEKMIKLFKQKQVKVSFLFVFFSSLLLEFNFFFF